MFIMLKALWAGALTELEQGVNYRYLSGSLAIQIGKLTESLPMIDLAPKIVVERCLKGVSTSHVAPKTLN